MSPGACSAVNGAKAEKSMVPLPHVLGNSEATIPDLYDRPGAILECIHCRMAVHEADAHLPCPARAQPRVVYDPACPPGVIYGLNLSELDVGLRKHFGQPRAYLAEYAEAEAAHRENRPRDQRGRFVAWKRRLQEKHLPPFLRQRTQKDAKP